MAYNEGYSKRVEFMVRCLPHITEEECFALKGGTAINLFVRPDMPRLSVDIDLTYLPLANRTDALNEIDAALKRIAKRIKSADSLITIAESSPETQSTASRLILTSNSQVQIKMEVAPVLRGCVYEPRMLRISEVAEDAFGFAEMKLLSHDDIYAGKIVAALDRQNPRDLFDVMILLDSEGISDSLRTALVIYLISHQHSPHSLLNPKLKDITQEFDRNFVGMTEKAVPIDALLKTRTRLIQEVADKMPKEHQQFMISFYEGNPQWDLLGLQGASRLPAVRWRELNLSKSGEGTRQALVKKLKSVWKDELS